MLRATRSAAPSLRVAAKQMLFAAQESIALDA
jgi:hypothetical protein